MQLSNIFALSLATLLIFFFVHASAIQCFHCHSHFDESCGDPFEQSLNDSSHLVDCDALGVKNGRNYTFCRKTIQMAALRPDKETTRVIRSCGEIEESRFIPDENEDPSQMKCYRRVGTFNVELLFCGCYADGCNAGNLNVVAGTGVMMLSIFIVLLHSVSLK